MQLRQKLHFFLVFILFVAYYLFLPCSQSNSFHEARRYKKMAPHIGEQTQYFSLFNFNKQLALYID